MFKNMRLVILFEMFLNPRFKMTTSFANIARTTASTSRLNHQELGLYMKNNFLILNKLKTSLMLKFSLQNSLQSFESLFLIWCERLPTYGNLK